MTTNASVFPYELSIHAAWMLVAGIRNYIRDAQDELPSYCCLMLSTAKKETQRLLEWVEKIDYNNLKVTTNDLKNLLEEIETLQRKYVKLEIE